MIEEIRVGIIGEYDPKLPNHIATNEALNHAADTLSIPLKISWLSTQPLNKGTVGNTLKQFHGIWGAPSDYTNIDGALRAIRFARETKLPFIGT